MLYQEQPDGTGRISDGCNRDGSRAPHWCITGGLHPRSSVTLRLATTGHAARMPPAPHQCRAADFRAHRSSLQGVWQDTAATAATARWAAIEDW
jgi:hypothetical protein